MTIGKSQSGLPSLATADDGHLDCLLSVHLSVIRSEDDQNSQDLDCLLSLLLSVIRSALAISHSCQ